MAKEGYGLVYQQVTRDQTISMEAKAIYAYLCSFAGADGTCYPSLELMCKELDATQERVRKHLKALRAAGYVSVERQRNGSLFGNNIYKIHHEGQETDFPSKENRCADNLCMEKPRTENQWTENTANNNNSTNNNSLNNNSTNNRNNTCFRVCAILNRAKERLYSKGRLKSSAGQWVIDRLLSNGYTPEEIEAAARHMTETVSNDNAIQWYKFWDYCEEDYKNKGD